MGFCFAGAISLAEAAATEATVLIVTALLELPAGVFADKFGNKKSLLVGGILHGLGIMLMATGGSLGIFTIAAVLSGAAWAFMSGADEAYIHDDYIENKSHYQRVFANASIVDEAATIGGMLLSSLLLFVHADMRTLFIVSAIFLFLSVIYMQVMLPDSKSNTRKDLHANNLSFISFNFSLKAAKSILPLIIAFALIYESGRVLWQPQLGNIGLNIESFGLVFALFKIASILGSVAARHYQAFNITKLSLLFICMTISLVLFGASSLILSASALAIFLFSENYFRIYMSATLNKAIQNNRATLLSLGSLVRNILGSGLIVAAGILGQKSILFALIALAAFKIPGILYILHKHKTLMQELAR
jgi:MFS family permease